MPGTRNIIALALCLVLTGLACGQTITPTKVSVTKGYTNPVVVGDFLLAGDNSKPETVAGYLLTIEAEPGQVCTDFWAASLPSFEEATINTLKDGSRLLVGSGRYFIEAEFDNPKAKKRFSLELSPPKPPEPPRPPTPDVPTDMFDNIGQRTAAWANGLPRRDEIAALYDGCADELKNKPTTINKSVEKMVKARESLLKPDELAAWKPLLDQLNADVRKRPPMAQVLMADYFSCVALGLRGAK